MTLNTNSVEVKPANSKFVMVSIIGKPNAGKSSLLNKLLGQKLSIVTPKVQTTRSIINGILAVDNTQIMLLDTPGIFEPKKRLEKAMVKCAWSSLSGADIVALIIDGNKVIDNLSLDIIKRLLARNIKPIILLNKIDIKSTKFDANLGIILGDFKELKLFPISALTGQNVEQFLAYVVDKAPLSPWLYDEDTLTTLPQRFIASEITREQLFLNLHEELPYNMIVETEEWKNNADGSVKINQVIIVSRDSYKIMVLGKNGSQIKIIGTKAREEIQRVLDLKVHLFLFVKVRPNWEDNAQNYDYMGLKLGPK